MFRKDRNIPIDREHSMTRKEKNYEDQKGKRGTRKREKIDGRGRGRDRYSGPAKVHKFTYFLNKCGPQLDLRTCVVGV